MNFNFGLRQSDVIALHGILEKYPAIEQACIFGSRAKGNFRPGSDVDIALKGTGLTLHVINNISFELNEETTMPYKFDVLNYHTITDPALLDHINRAGIVFYEKASTS